MARASLAAGEYLLTGGFDAEAGRAAYMAAFHAAQAFIFSRTGRSPKTHGGTRSEFARLAQAEPGIERAHVAFIVRAYELKASADYDQSEPVTPEDARRALAAAAEFVAAVSALAIASPEA